MNKIMTFIFAPIIVCLIPVFSFGQGQSEIDYTRLVMEGKRMIQNGMDQWKVDILLNARGIFERTLSIQEKDYLLHYYLAYADYRLCVMYFSQKDNKSAGKYIDEGIDHLERSIALKSGFAESHALLASLYGFKIGMKWYLGMTLGPKAGSSFDKAVQADSLNPRIYLLLGISKYHTPSMFGGGTDKAKFYLMKSAQLYENSTTVDSLLPDWGREEVFAWLGKISMDEKDYTQAGIQFDRALQTNPEYSWVKFELRRELAEKMKEGK